MPVLPRREVCSRCQRAPVSNGVGGSAGRFCRAGYTLYPSRMEGRPSAASKLVCPHTGWGATTPLWGQLDWCEG